ncbi:MAG: ABC transporter ATP-binding protein [Oscillospiraceae bacterium]|nr:ABC transporter ATP-binding protein [Oscillospiraceae bacterium]
MKLLTKYLKPYLLYCVLGPLFKLLEVVFELYVPLVVKDLIENGIAFNSLPVIIRCTVTIIILGILGFLSALLAQHFAAKVSTHAVGDMKESLFTHIQCFSFNQLDSVGKSTLFSRMTSDMNQIQTGINLALRLLLRSPFVVFGAMIMAFMVNKECAFYFVVLIPILFIITFAILLFTIPMFSKSQNKLDQLVNITRENLTGTRVIRAFRHEKEEIAEFGSVSDLLLRIQNISSALSTVLNPITTILVNIFIVLLIRNGLSLFQNGEITQGDILALYNYMSMILVELIKLSNLVITITKSLASADRVDKIFEVNPLDTPHTILNNEHTDAEDSDIVFENASYMYPDSNIPALFSLSFDIEPGKTLGIIGGIGSGKTTLGHLIAGYYLPTEGIVKVFGYDTSSSYPSDIRNSIGYVFQKASLISGTVRSNLKWGCPDASDEDMINALETAQAWSYLQEKEGLDTKVEREGRNFSGGQRQRLSIARALVKKPRLLIMDDSASALDYITESRLRLAISKLQWHPTVVIISQRITSILHADNIIVLQNGKLVGYGSHSELLSTCSEYQEIAISQGMEV